MLLAACSGPARPRPQRQPSHQPVARWTLDTAGVEVAADLRASAATARVRPVGALSLSDGRTAVLDDDAPRVLYFDRRGTLERVVELQPPGAEPRVQAHRLVRVAGDTIGALASGRAFVLDGRGDVVRAVDATVLGAPGARRRRIPVVLAPLVGGRTVVGFIGPQQPPSPGVARWVDSMTVVVVDSGMTVVQELGRWPAMYLAVENGRPRQVWFAPHAVITSRDSVLYFGFGSDYRIDAYTGSGRLHRSFARPWSRVQVTPADIDAYIEGWSKNWMKGTPAEVERGKRDMHADPFFPYVPAFSELLVAFEGELWVRTPSLTDAQSAGELYHRPLVPSHWSIFDRDGRWVGEATLPAFSHPRDVRDGSVLTVERGANGGQVLRRRLRRL